MTNRFSSLLLSMIVLCTLFLISCSKDNYVQDGDTLTEAYQKSLQLLEDEDYQGAIQGFDYVFRIGRGTEYATDAQYYLAEAHFGLENYLIAASEYDRFASLFPTSPRRVEVDYKAAYCYYRLSPDFKLDQRYTRIAIERFNLFESNYPNSSYIPELVEYENELRAKLARKLYSAADLYMRIDQFESATIYYGLAFDRYPETVWAERALVDQINAFVEYADNSVLSAQRDRYMQAVESYERYLQAFPQGENRSLAEDYVDEARRALAALDDSSSNDSSDGATASVND